MKCGLCKYEVPNDVEFCAYCRATFSRHFVWDDAFDSSNLWVYFFAIFIYKIAAVIVGCLLNLDDFNLAIDLNKGLIWEIKTDDDGLRDKDWKYSWYKPEGDNGGDAGYAHPYEFKDYYGYKSYCKESCDTYSFTNAVNQNGLCGAKDWRMPTIDELKGLLTKTNAIKKGLYINSKYFPNTNGWYWSSSPYAKYSECYALYVSFSYGNALYYLKNEPYYVRLVRSEQEFFELGTDFSPCIP